MLLLHPTSRGVGLLGDKVYFAAADAVLIALDAKTGNEVWKTTVEDYTHGYYMSLAPLVADGKVIVGVSGGELGVRGFVAAFDAETGKPAWKTYTVPEPGERGSETWPKGDQWKTGGGSVWITANYDPDTNISFFDGKPFVKQNVFLKLDPETGRPDVDPARQPGTGKKADFCPSLWGGKDWPPVAYSPKTRLLYIPANENLCGTITGEPATYT